MGTSSNGYAGSYQYASGSPQIYSDPSSLHPVAPAGYSLTGNVSILGAWEVPAGTPFSISVSKWINAAGNVWYGDANTVYNPASVGIGGAGKIESVPQLSVPSPLPAPATVVHTAAMGQQVSQPTPTILHDIAVYQEIPVAQRSAAQKAALATDLATASKQGGITILPNSVAPVTSAQKPSTTSQVAGQGTAPIGIDLTGVGQSFITALEGINAGLSAAAGPVAKTVGDAINNLQNNPQTVSQWAAQNIGNPAGKTVGGIADVAGSTVGAAAAGAGPGVGAGVGAAAAGVGSGVGSAASGAGAGVGTGLGAAVGGAVSGASSAIGGALSGLGISPLGLGIGAAIILVALFMLKEA